MHSARAEIVKWEKNQNVPQALGGVVFWNDPKINWDESRFNILTIRQIERESESTFYSEPTLYGAIAKINGTAICGVINGGKDGLYVCCFNSEVDFKVGSTCTVTWERYLEWG